MEYGQGIEVRRSRGQDGYAGRQPLVMPIPVPHLEHQSELQELKERLVEQIARMDKLIEQETREGKVEGANIYERKAERARDTY
ncbi:hypothetical protein K1719_030923 [Acacia pycnantha]|nr:hypothetical protein K1719_030923 [Acacia pycnantha]